MLLLRVIQNYAKKWMEGNKRWKEIKDGRKLKMEEIKGGRKLKTEGN